MKAFLLDFNLLQILLINKFIITHNCFAILWKVIIFNELLNVLDAVSMESLSRKNIVLLYAFFMNSFTLLGLDYYWIGGSGSWSDLTHWATTSGGTILHTTIPGTNDNVFFDANSGPSNINLTINVNTIYTRDLIFMTNCPSVIFSASTYDFDIFGNVQLQPNVSFPINDAVSWNCSGSNNQTFRSNGVPLSRIKFKGAGTYELLDSLWINYEFILESGGFNSNGHKISCQIFSARDVLNSPSKNFNLSEIHIFRNGWHTSFELTGGGNFLFIGSKINLDGAPARVSLQTSDTVEVQRIEYQFGAQNELNTNGYAHIRRLNLKGVNQFINVTKIDTLAYDSNTFIALNESPNDLKIISILSLASACSGGLHIQGRQPTMCNIWLPGQISLDNAAFRNIHVLNGSINANNSVDYGNNSGLNFTNLPPQTYYWVNGAGGWNDSSHWSLSSGGTPTSCVPRSIDHVVFDQNSAYGSLTVNLPRVVHAASFSSHTLYPISFYGPSYLYVHGSIITNRNATFNLNNNWYPSGLVHFSKMKPNSDSIAIKSIIQGHLYILGSGDVQYWDSTRVSGEFRVLGGSNHFSNKYLASNYLSDQWAMFGYYNIDSSFIDFSNATVEIKDGYYFDNVNLFWNETGSSFRILSNGGWGFTYCYNKPFWKIELPLKGNKFNMNGYALRARMVDNHAIMDIHSFASIDLDTLVLGADSRLLFENPLSVDVDTIITNTDCNSFAGIQCLNDTTEFILQSGDIETNFLYVQNISNNSSNASWTSINSNDLGGNSNIIFSQSFPRTLFWIGGSGSWADSAHWSLTSGGIGGECIPTSVDSVVFDTSGFSGMTDTIYISNNRAYAHDIVVTHNGNLRFKLEAQGMINPHGSVIFQKNTFVESSNNAAGIEFFGNDSSFFKTNNALIHSMVRINKSGSLSLIDSLKCPWGDRGLDIINGGFYSLGYPIYTDHVFLIPGNISDSAYVDLSGSRVDVLGDWECFVAYGNLTYVGYGTHIYASSDRSRVEIRDSTEIRHLEFSNSTNSPHTTLTCNYGGKINFLNLEGNLKFNGTTIVDTLILKPDYTYLFEPNKVHTVNDSLRARGDFCHYIGVKSQVAAQQATLITNNPVSGDFLEIRDINYAGNSTFFTGSNSSNQGNNSGFTWLNQPGYIYGFPQDTVHLFCHSSLVNDSIELRTDNFNDAVGFLWSTGDSASSIWVKQSGNYWVGADYVSCMVYDTIMVNLSYLEPISGSQTAVCSGSTVSLLANGGNSQFRYEWSTGDTTINSAISVNNDTVVWVNIFRGNWFFCSDSIELKASEIDSLQYLVTNPHCFGDSSGVINISQIFGGYGPFEYEWSHDTSLQGNVAYNLGKGCYAITVIDTLGCFKTDTICLSEPLPLSMQISKYPPVCSYDLGSVSVYPQGGSGNYQISYVNFNPSQMLPGTYTVTVVDTNGCTLDSTFNLESGQEFVYTVQVDTATCMYSNGSVTVIPGIQNAPYEYFWSALPFFQGNPLTSLPPGASGYIVVIDTITNCRDTASYLVPFGGVANAFFTLNQSNGPTPLVIETTNANPSSVLNNFWILNGDTVSTAIDTIFIIRQYGTYYLEHCIYDPQFDCTQCYEYIIQAEPNPALEVPNVFTPNGDGINDLFIPQEFRDLDVLDIQIYSRSGQLVWRSSELPFTWDGSSILGGMCPDGVYFWIIQYQEALSQETIYLKGTVTLLQ